LGCYGKTVLPVLSAVPREDLVALLPNAISFEKYPVLRERFMELFSLSSGPCNASERLAEFLCCLPKFAALAGLSYEKRLPLRHRAVHGPVQFRSRRRETLLHPFRQAERSNHPVRHL
jgi:hypothetical protein